MPPPGIEGDLREVTAGGDTPWKPIARRKLFTNAFIWSKAEAKILLGLKKRGFGKNLYNGFGGKVELDETPAEAALRELKEEAGIEASLEHCGTLLFVVDGVEYAHNCEIYRSEDYTGSPIETDEMHPEWFAIPSGFLDSGTVTADSNMALRLMPLDQMWADDILWMPLLLTGQHFVGRIDFGKEGDKDVMTRWWVGTVNKSGVTL